MKRVLIINSNLSNAASLLWHAYKSLSGPSNEVNWAGMNLSSPEHHFSD